MTISPSEFVDAQPAKWFSDFIGNLPAGVFRIAVDGDVVFCNRTCARIFGFNSDNELMGYPAINLCRNKANRGEFLKTIREQGFVDEFRMGLRTKDGNPLLCSVTARGFFDDQGKVVFLDGILKHIIEKDKGEGITVRLDRIVDTLDDFVLLINPEGELLDINKAGADFFRLPKERLLKEPLSKYLSPKYKDLISFFLTDILETGQIDGVLTIMGKIGARHHLDFYAILVKGGNIPTHIRIIGRDITEQIELQRERLRKEKLQGVLEMAGGVAHRLNQPLTVVNNLLREVLPNRHTCGHDYQKVMKVHGQMEDLNEIARKINSIKRYETMDYIGKIKIIDIDKASETDDYQDETKNTVREKA